MLRRVLGILLTVGVLCTTGVASGTPCCTLLRLDPGNRAGDCCGSSGCCRIEKRGPAQAALLAKAPEAAAPEASSVSRPLFLAGAEASSPTASARERLFRTDHPPPPGSRDTYLKISLFRI
jgi:hypothetical protein